MALDDSLYDFPSQCLDGAIGLVEAGLIGLSSLSLSSTVAERWVVTHRFLTNYFSVCYRGYVAVVRGGSVRVERDRHATPALLE